MDKNSLRRFGWAVYLLVGALAVVIFLVAGYVPKESVIHDLMINLSATLLAVMLVFFLVDQFFQWKPEYEQLKQLCDQQDKQLRTLGEVLQGVAENLQTFKMREVDILPTREDVYASLSDSSHHDKWTKVRLFAPVGLWGRDSLKKGWLTELVQWVCSSSSEPREAWCVYGLPPAEGEGRSIDEVRRDLEYARELMDVLDHSSANEEATRERMKQIVIHYYPPFPSSVGLGVCLFEKKEKNGGLLAFALTTHRGQEIVDWGFSLNNDKLFLKVSDWFDHKIFAKETGQFVLQDEHKSVRERWADVVRDSYGEKYLTASEVQHAAQSGQSEELPVVQLEVDRALDDRAATRIG